MKTILFPTDFSKNAENALHYALEFSLRLDARLIIMNVSLLPYGVAARIEDAVKSVEAFYDENLQRLIKKTKEEERYKNLTIEGKTVSGSIVYSILETAESNNADLIVMGTKGASGLERVLFGSNTAEILRKASMPVLVVPRAAVYKKFDKLIYALDYRDDDLEILRELSKLAELFEVSIETLHVAPKDSIHEQIMHRGLVQLIDDKLSSIFSNHHLIINPSFAEGIESYLNDHSNSLLALAHYKKPFMDSLLTKSITNEMAYHTKTPILVFNQSPS